MSFLLSFFSFCTALHSLLFLLSYYFPKMSWGINDFFLFFGDSRAKEEGLDFSDSCDTCFSTNGELTTISWLPNFAFFLFFPGKPG